MSRARELADLSNVINKGANLQPNLAFNGDMSVWQRGTSANTASTGDYMCDRWRVNFNGLDGNVDWDQETSSTPDGFAYALKISTDASEISLDANDYLYIRQSFEGQYLQHLQKGTSTAKKVTVSFWVKSSVASTYTVELRDNDNIKTIGVSYTINTADTWEYKTVVFEGDTSGPFDNDTNNSLDLSWYMDAGTTFTSGTFQTSWGTTTNANRIYDTTGWLESTSPEFYITGVSLVVGDTAPVTHPYESYAENLQRCKRYYQELNWTTNFIFDNAQSTNVYHFYDRSLDGEMRATPTSTKKSGSIVTLNIGDGGITTIDAANSKYVAEQRRPSSSSRSYAYTSSLVMAYDAEL